MNQDETIKQILLREAYVSSEDIKKAEEYAKQNNSSIENLGLDKEVKN